MKTFIFILFAFINQNCFCQKVKYTDLIPGKWKESNYPDSSKGSDNVVRESPFLSFIFIDSNKVDVMWNVFKYRKQSYEIEPISNLIYVHVDSLFENVPKMDWLIKYVDKNTIKIQGIALSTDRIPWTDNETWYNTYIFHRQF